MEAGDDRLTGEDMRSFVKCAAMWIDTLTSQERLSESGCKPFVG